MNSRIAFALALLTTAAAGTEHAVFDESFDGGSAGWSGLPGFFWDDLNGHVTPSGTVRTLGSGVHSMESPCIRIDDQAVLASQYFLRASGRANTDASWRLISRRYTGADCTGSIGDSSGQINLQQDSWLRVNSPYGNFLPPTLRSLRLVFEYESLGTSFFSSFIDDVQIINEGPEEILQNARFFDDASGWSLHWGDQLSHAPSEGDGSGVGAARVDGHTDSFAGINQGCIDLTQQRDPDGEFHVGASVRASSSVGGPPGADIYVDFFTDTGCTSMSGRRQIITDGTVGAWSRVEGTFVPPAGTQGVRVIVATFNAPDGAVTYFDDATFYSSTVFSDGFESGDVSGKSSRPLLD